MSKEKKHDFKYALDAMKNGSKVSRFGWNGKGQFVFMAESGDLVFNNLNHPMSDYPMQACFFLKNAQDFLMPWVPSIGDCLAEDWLIVGQLWLKE